MPKVIIDNCLIPGVWYEGKKGTVLDIEDYSDGVYRLKNGCSVLMTDGELLYTESEYTEILKQRDKAIDDLAKHAETIKNLREEIAMLLQQIERTVDEQKVELPREVAEALKSFWDDGHDVDKIIRLMLSSLPNSPRVRAIRSYAISNGGEFVSALVKGYTVEPEPRDKVKQFIEKWYTEPNGDDTDAELYELADGILDLLQQTSP
ncbi:hypothetical protein ACM1RC_27460 [Paenibacillus azoreducens]|uniref:hypothetical protein n=1 Tax=Paenibacillus azoreducens TaxID=116718 RepID=UPI0039F44FA1